MHQGLKFLIAHIVYLSRSAIQLFKAVERDKKGKKGKKSGKKKKKKKKSGKKKGKKGKKEKDLTPDR